MALKLANLFLDNAAYQTAYAQFTQVDRAFDPNEPPWDLGHGPAPDMPVLRKLDELPNATVALSGGGGGKPEGSTTLLGRPAGGQGEQDLTMASAQDLRAWMGNNPNAAFGIVVEAKTGQSTRYPGTIVEILDHELAAHAEPFADFITAERAQPGAGHLGTMEEQHKWLHDGNPRYRLIGARYVTAHAADGEGQRFVTRMQQDFVTNATLPPGVWPPQ